jgi:2-oxoglutarate ferredoxin oxidoreductase subunit beta
VTETLTAKKHPLDDIIRADRLPHIWCPGCGIGIAMRCYAQAILESGIPINQHVVVSGIGCTGRVAGYMNIDSYHTTHGRAIPFASGMKLANPDLMLTVFSGDGDLAAIGGNHLIHAARRNIDIKVICVNNFNYGMTGGQHSVTTPTGGSTSDTPWGNVEAPLDLCATAAAAGAGWVYRATTFDDDLTDVLVQAISRPGFAMVDVWELCTAYYQPQNRMKKRGLFELMDGLGFRRGLLVDKPRTEYTELYRQATDSGGPTIRKKPPIEPCHRDPRGGQRRTEGQVDRHAPGRRRNLRRSAGDPERRLPDHREDRPLGGGDHPEPGANRVHGDRCPGLRARGLG